MAELSKTDKKLLDDVEKYGWHVVKVMEDETGPGFGYSIGFFKTFGHSEIIIVGLGLDLIHSIINGIGEGLREGKSFRSGEFYSGLIEGYDCYFAVVDLKYYHDYVGYCRWFYKGNDFSLLQCIYPTKKNVYPWQGDWPEEISNLQPILAEDGLMFPKL
jgi:hypothetical protein